MNRSVLVYTRICVTMILVVVYRPTRSYAATIHVVVYTRNCVAMIHAVVYTRICVALIHVVVFV